MMRLLRLALESCEFRSRNRCRYYIPSAAEPWFKLGEEDDDESNESMEHWLKEVEVKVAGMPRIWKLVNVWRP